MPTALSRKLRTLKEQGMSRMTRRRGTKSRAQKLADRQEAKMRAQKGK